MEKNNPTTKDLPGAGDMPGGCQCGAVRYRIAGDPMTTYVCHCKDCQKQSSSAFGISLWIESTQFCLLSGDLCFYLTRGESGAVKKCAYCKHCGSRIYHTSDQADAVLSIKGGSLDDTLRLRPIAQLWTRSAQRWAIMDSGQMPCFETEPPDDQALIDLWCGVDH